MIISREAEKTFVEIQHSWAQQLGFRGNVPQYNQDHI